MIVGLSRTILSKLVDINLRHSNCHLWELNCNRTFRTFAIWPQKSAKLKDFCFTDCLLKYWFIFELLQSGTTNINA